MNFQKLQLKMKIYYGTASGEPTGRKWYLLY